MATGWVGYVNLLECDLLAWLHTNLVSSNTSSIPATLYDPCIGLHVRALGPFSVTLFLGSGIKEAKFYW